jgi:AcrR family transcriptional regulator
MEAGIGVRRRILEAAAEVFAREGFAGARVEHIAKAAGVNKAGLYYHVGNKARLFEEVMVEHFSEVAARMERAAASSETPGSVWTPWCAFWPRLSRKGRPGPGSC